MRAFFETKWAHRMFAPRLLASVWTLVGTAVAVAQQPVALPPIADTTDRALAFQGATVIDVVSGRRVPNQTIVVVGNRIQAVGPVGRVRTPPDTRVIPANGTFVIPGLWDMHVHVFGFPNTFFPLFIANGVTGVRDMGAAFLDSMLLWRREIKDGHRAGPRVVTAGPSVSDPVTIAQVKASYPKGVAFHAVGAGTPAEGRHVVDSLKHAGADFIKVYSYLKRDVYFAIAAEARRIGLPFGGHLPDSISVLEASDSGQHSIEHGLPPETGCFGTDTLTSSALKRCRALAARLRRNDTWVMPGPVMKCVGCQLPWYREQDRYHPDSLYDLFGPTPGRPPHEPRAQSMALAQWAEIHGAQGPEASSDRRDFGLAQRAGIRLIAGTDAAAHGWTSGLRPGFSLHDMLWDLAHSGLTPLEALQTATLNPAQYFHATDSMGTVAAGKVADFLFLDADPLVDIFNTRRIRAVVADGRFYDRADLDSLLVGAERLAKQSRRP